RRCRQARSDSDGKDACSLGSLRCNRSRVFLRLAWPRERISVGQAGRSGQEFGIAGAREKLWGAPQAKHENCVPKFALRAPAGPIRILRRESFARPRVAATI